MASETKEAAAIDDLVQRLAVKYPTIGTRRVHEIVIEAYASLTEAKVRDYVPVLVERAAKQALRLEAPTAEA